MPPNQSDPAHHPDAAMLATHSDVRLKFRLEHEIEHSDAASSLGLALSYQPDAALRFGVASDLGAAP